MFKNLFMAFAATIIISSLSAQTGVLKGSILDIQSESGLIGCNVIIADSDPLIGATSDMDGNFRMENVPVGRVTLSVSYIGYEPQVIPNVVVTAGKEVILEIKLAESLRTLEAVVVKAEADKDRANNEMATMSVRQFSLEEVRRFSGGRGDVARLASNFAGVSSPDDSRNDIVIRGNSPTGVLWRVDGLPIPNPNHFSTFGTTGGPVSALNPNMMKNSDFITSAFPAEYGNALAGVFDIRFRNGNRDKAEHSFQAGAFSGLEATTEGPLRAGKGSYLLAGRYSLVGLIGGAAGTNATPIYSDLSLKVDLGKTKLGRFELFALGGNSHIDLIGAEADTTDLFASQDEDSFYEGNFIAGGIVHTLPIKSKSYLKTAIGTSYTGSSFKNNRYPNPSVDSDLSIRYFEVASDELRLTASTKFNSKINSRMTLRTGFVVEQIATKASLKDRDRQEDLDGDGYPDLTTLYDVDGDYIIAQPYAQTVYRLNEKLSANLGLHGQYYGLAEQFELEPRFSLQYALNSGASFKAGYGIHHQPTPGPILFLNHLEEGVSSQRNNELAMTRSQHYVFGYDQRFAKEWRAKIEVYYQDIDAAAVDRYASSFSALTEGADFGFSVDKTDLVNEGTAYNQGLELTLEKFFSNTYYMLMTGSFFEAKYAGSDGVERNSPFNNGYVLNLLAGKEFPLDSKERRVVFVDTKLTTSGGKYYTPVNLEASQQAGFQIGNTEEAFSLQNDSYFRWDVKFGAKFNSQKKKISHQFYLDLQNVLDTENIFARRYNRQTNKVDVVYQTGFFPDFGYRVQF